MDKRLKEIVDNFDSMKIGVDEPFRFHCTMCGKCCINREDILLTPRDIWNSHGLQLSWRSIWNTTRVRIFSLNLRRTLKKSLIS